MKSTVYGLCAFFIAMAVFWYGGVDWMERSPLNAYFLVVCGLFGVGAKIWTRHE